jgi:hypothetical protein
MVLTGDSADMADRFGVTAHNWDGGGLSNSGEDIVIIDDMGAIIDTVDFEDNSKGWPTVCDGAGPSLVLCDVNSDNNDPANWGFSTTPSGVREDEDSAMIFWSPGAANAACSTDPAYFFNGTYAEVVEGAGTVDVSFVVAHTGPMDTADIVLTVNAGASTATLGTDFTYTTVTTGISPRGIGGITYIDIAVPILDDMLAEGDETIVFNLGAGMVGGVTPRFLPTGDFVVKILDNDIPLPRYDIAVISADANNDGEADSLGIRCEIQGIVHGIDLQGGGSVQFTIIDSTGGIGLFSGNAFGYTVTEGDEVLIPGEVSSFRGLAQMTPDTIIVVSTGNATVTPMVVTSMSEATESELITFECVTLLDTSDWPTSGGSVNLDFSNGVDTFSMRIDSDVDLNGTPPPTSKWLNITGIGGQFSFTPSELEGYQLLPRYMADVVELGNPAVALSSAADTVDEAGATVNISVDLTNGNPDSTSVTVSLAASSSTATEGSDFSFSDTTFHFNGCGADAASFDLSITDDMDPESDETIVLVISSVTNSAEVTTDTVTIVITDNDNVGIEDQLGADAISLYPNPATDKLVIDASLPIERLQVLNLVGQEVMSMTHPSQKTTLSIAQLPKGTYLVRALTAEGVWTAKWVKM